MDTRGFFTDEDENICEHHAAIKNGGDAYPIPAPDEGIDRQYIEWPIN